MLALAGLGESRHFPPTVRFPGCLDGTAAAAAGDPLGWEDG